MRFEWNEAKATSNRQKHRVTFQEAATVFTDPLTLIAPDAVHPERFIILGRSSHSRLLFVVYVEKHHGETIRIISARQATRAERHAYEEGTFDDPS